MAIFSAMAKVVANPPANIVPFICFGEIIIFFILDALSIDMGDQNLCAKI